MTQQAKVADAAAVAGDRARTSTFRALRNRNYRYLWTGQVGHSASMWMENVIRPLLVLHLTNSAFQVGLVVAIRMAPMLILGLLGGAVADRYDKRRVLMYSQMVTFVSFVILAALLLTDLIQTWQVFLTAFISGGAMAFNQPARQAIVPRLVPREDLLNAVALNNAAMNIMRVAGAGLAGLLLILFDFGEVYLLNAVIYVGVIWSTIRMVVPAGEGTGKPKVSLAGDLMEGFRYMGSNRNVLCLVGMAVVLFAIGQPYQQVYVPLLAVEVLDIGRSGVGLMLALTGVGALIGSLLVASKGSIPNRGLVMMGSLAGFSVTLIVLAESRWLPLSLLALFFAGIMTVTYMALNSSLLLEEAPPEYHGRVMSLMSMDRGVMPVGAILGGALAHSFGTQIGLTVMGAICLTLTVLIFFFVPTLRRMR